MRWINSARCLIAPLLCVAATHAMASPSIPYPPIPQNITTECKNILSKLADQKVSVRAAEAGFVFEFDVALKPQGAQAFQTQEFRATLNCMKTGHQDYLSDSLYLSVDYDHLTVRQHPALKNAKLPDDALMNALSPLLGLALLTPDHAAKGVLRTCFASAESKPTDQYSDRDISEKTYSGSLNRTDYECTRRVKREFGATTLLFKSYLTKANAKAASSVKR